MAKMRLTVSTTNFRANHAVATVYMLANAVRAYRLEVARPATTRIELGVGVKKGALATDTTV